jgi:hypothetical protein
MDTTSGLFNDGVTNIINCPQIGCTGQALMI